MMTKKAETEIAKLTDEKARLEQEIPALTARMTDCRDSVVFHAYRKERDRRYIRLEAVDQRLESVKNSGLSSAERTAIGRAAAQGNGWIATVSDRSLGVSGATKVGYYKPLAAFFVVRYSRYNGFMRNVRGCSSLAGKTHVHEVSRLTQAEAVEALATYTRYGFTGSPEITARPPEEIDRLVARMLE